MNKKRFKKILIIILSYGILFSYVPTLFTQKVSLHNKELIAEQLENNTSKDHLIRYIDDGKESLKVKIEMIKSAEKEIDLSYYRVSPGKTTDLIMGALVQAADRGVKIRMVVDGKLHNLSKDYQALLTNHPNISLKLYNPFNPLKPWEWNSVLHDKYLRIDDTYLLVGGRNLGDQYYQPTRHHTQDLEVLVYNPNHELGIFKEVKEFADRMHASPYVKNKHKKVNNYTNLKMGYLQHIEAYESDVEQLKLLNNYIAVDDIKLFHNPINTGIKEPLVGYVYQQLALSAKMDVKVQTPYATGYRQLLQTFNKLIENDVNVTYLTNSLSSSPNYPAFSNYMLHRKEFIKTGIHIFEYQSDGSKSLHTKALLIDDTLSVVGSFNLDHRSLSLNTETIVYLKGKEANQALQEIFNKRIKESNEITSDAPFTVVPGNIPLKKRILMIISGFFSYILEPMI